MTAFEPTAMSERDALLLAYLAEQEANCPVCGYNVHRITVPRCPECGHHLQLKLRTRDGLSWSWLMVLVVSAVNAGCGVLFWAVVYLNRFPRWNDGIVLVLTVWAYLLLTPGPLAVLAGRRWFARWPAWLRRGALLTAVVLSAGLMIVLLRVLR